MSQETNKVRASDEQRLRSMAANLLFGLALVDKNLRLLRSNRKFHAFFSQHKPGTRLCETLQHACFDNGASGHVGPVDYASCSASDSVPNSDPTACLNCPARRALQEGQNFEREFVRRTPAGQEQYFRMVCSPAKFLSGAAGGQNNAEGLPSTQTILVLIEDITRKRLLEQKLLRAQRLEAMSTLAGGIAHEINQPLSALNLYASGLQILLDKPDLPPAQVLRERIGLILEQARKISDITRHMRAMGTHSSVAQEPVDVLEALNAALQPLQSKLRAAGIRLELRNAAASEPQNGVDEANHALTAESGLPPVKAIAVQLNQVFTNLLNNAVQAVMAGSAGKPEKSGIIRISTRAEGDRVLIEVADSGQGVPPGMERRIFDPFFSTKGPNDGLGLGLSITHAFVSSWGGEILVHNQHPELGGAVFVLNLRAAEQ